MVIRIYWASVTGNRKVDGDQTRLRYLIESLNIPSQWVDITTDPLVKEKMREECGKPKAMPPQIFNEFKYLGEVADMEVFVEQERIMEFFGLADVTSDDITRDKNFSKNESFQPKDVVSDDAKSIDERLRNSTTSCIKNDATVCLSIAPPCGIEPSENSNSNGAGDQPTRTSVLKAAVIFESLNNSSFHKNNSKMALNQVQSFSTSSSEDKKPSDDERSRRILGLSATENSQIEATVTSQEISKNAINGRRSVKKVSMVANLQ